MENMLACLFSRHGTTLVWTHNGESTTIRGFLQPVTSRSWQKWKREVTVLGEANVGVYVYSGPASFPVAAGDTLQCHGRQYAVRRSEVWMLGDRRAYRWALCARVGGEGD